MKITHRELIPFAVVLLLMGVSLMVGLYLGKRSVSINRVFISGSVDRGAFYQVSFKTQMCNLVKGYCSISLDPVVGFIDSIEPHAPGALDPLEMAPSARGIKIDKIPCVWRHDLPKPDFCE